MVSVNIMDCPLWGGGRILPRSGDYYAIESRRAGGCYRISGTALALFTQQKHPTLAAKLTTWIVDQHRFGELEPMITEPVLTTVANKRRLRTSDQLKRFFLLLDSRQFRLGDSLNVAGTVDQKQRDDVDDLCAWLELEDPRELNQFVRILIEERLVTDNVSRIILTA
jgi:hypothetical protein